MKISKTKIPGAYIIERSPFKDERGAFVRMFCKRELEEAGLCADISQINHCSSVSTKTLRGLHCQSGGATEDKLVSCISGAVFDVCVDVREDSPTYLQWVGVTLSSDNGLALYTPKGCAHGYLSLTENIDILYFSTSPYNPEFETGYRFDDPAFGIKWPLPGPYIISEKDSSWKYIERQ